ncbi:MAG TPA: hypothetical protein VF212_01600 [Longimicrobiales bacterium]
MSETAVMKRTSAADRAFVRYNLLTPSEVARRLQEQGGGRSAKERITADTIRSWIEEPREELRLRAVDARSAGADRPRWFTQWEWVEECLARRMNVPAEQADAA